MTDTIADLKAFVRAQLSANCDPAPPKTATSQKLHLSVWTTRGRRRAIGVELDHKDRVNLWVISMYAPPSPPATVEIAKKVCMAGQRPRSHAQRTRRGKQQSQGLRRVPNQTDHAPRRSAYQRRLSDLGAHVLMSIGTEAQGVRTSQYGKCFENNKSLFIKELKA